MRSLSTSPLTPRLTRGKDEEKLNNEEEHWPVIRVQDQPQRRPRRGVSPEKISGIYDTT